MKQQINKFLKKVLDISTEYEHQFTGLCLDSRKVSTGDVFLAYEGTTQNGNHFIEQAFQNGAVAVFSDSYDHCLAYQKEKAVVVYVENLQKNVSKLAAHFYDNPSKDLTVIGVTGTNGKSSFCHFMAQALSYLNESVGIMGTLGNGIYGRQTSSTLTTADPITIQKTLYDFKQQAVNYVVMEVSSHALSQDRVAAVMFDTAVFTNLTRDHLDYHGDMAAYAAAKKKLFEFKSLRHLVINADDDFGNQLFENFRSHKGLISYLVNSTANLPPLTVKASQVHSSLNGITASIRTPWGEGLLHTKLLGLFNLYNTLAIVSALGAYGYDLERIISAIAHIECVPGRMQLLNTCNNPHVIIDYAHTPDALKQALQVIRGFAEGELWCVFGCGGERDVGKREEMGLIAELYADNIILTDDNPRGELPSKIIADIQKRMVAREKVVIEHDRRRAIAHAIHCAKPQDSILIAGKGHETYQIYGKEKQPFSDELEVQILLNKE